MRDSGIGSWAARRARKTPHKTAVLDPGGRFTYAEFNERVHRLAHGLRDLGVRRGDRVAYLGPNHHTFLEALFASGVLGAVFVPLNTRLAAPELGYCLEDSGSTVLIHSPALPAPAGAVRHTIAFGSGDPGSLDYEDLLADAAATPIDETIALDDPFMIMYTSGTTGRPKGALLTHGNLTWNAVNVLVDIDLASDETTLCVAPLFHTAGLNMTCLPTLLKGGTVVLEASFDAERALKLIETQGVTYMFGVPVMFDAIAGSRAWATADLSSLRLVSCGGAPVPPATIAAFLDRGVVFSQGYGLTEAAPGVLFLAGEDSVRKAGTAGVPHFFTDARVVDAESCPVAAGQKGEVMVSGPNVIPGYWARPEATERSFEGGWLRTGDIATVDDEGYISIVDRAKDMFISGGENVYPAEVERALGEHPDVADCAVIGVPDPTWGEAGKAIVVPTSAEHANETELLSFLRRGLAGYKVPKSLEFAGELPRSPSGKILRRVLREEYP
ncbi:acyl-CoA synthetase [Glycomyces buryatensis]|uniref:Long-chain fatty acid--CoA ligase n=1 Tax=Glycomyces buryatensis TaxID=2570927 RepID=A0A4S8PXR0_9ACTN|nr:long-chain fatty acid--CoA ligase [Glycomyces buryatensis]THV36483.1 long-chain fatty acid--CoA ligase [Glycomyces buryatensis]